MARERPSFEKTLESLEKIVEELESGSLTLDEALEHYERGMAAHKECSDILSAAEKRIEILLKRADAQFETAPFATGAGEPAGAADQDEEPDEEDGDCPF